jgi:hypothetical protein
VQGILPPEFLLLIKNGLAGWHLPLNVWNGTTGEINSLN